jgi:5S rRNA maturation endonuclease (ribonuclease M5)
LAPAGPRCDLTNLAEGYREAVNPGQLQELARSLGLSVGALTALGIGWSIHHHAWSFPMTDPSGQVLGIRLRRPNGFKFAVAGGKEGLFLPNGRARGTPSDPLPLLVCEGPTDTAALLDMGFLQVIGRPSCTGGIKLLVELVKQNGHQEVVIVADGDEPGQRGADNLASVMVAYAPAVRVIRPPDRIKDVREWLQEGGTRKEVEEAIQAATARRLSVRSKEVRRGRR